MKLQKKKTYTVKFHTEPDCLITGVDVEVYGVTHKLSAQQIIEALVFYIEENKQWSKYEVCKS